MTGPTPSNCELYLLRHAPVASGGRLYGRLDWPAEIDVDAAARLAPHLPQNAHVITSPALRCVQTAHAVLGAGDYPQDARLWEQDFGEHEGMSYADLPDIGNLGTRELSAYASPKGESFDALGARLAPALKDLLTDAPVLMVVHAGIIRAALGLALGEVALGLRFNIDNLSLTHITCDADGPMRINAVNATW